MIGTRARGPYEVKPRQLRALVLLLVLLPLLPTAFVVRFLVDEAASQRLEARERACPLYRQSLERTTAALAADLARPLPPATAADDPWDVLDLAPPAAVPADSLLLIDPAGNLSLPPLPDAPRLRGAALSATVLQSVARSVVLPRASAPRWRYFGDLPEPVFVLRPVTRPDLLLLLTRQHLRERIEAFYQRESNAQLAVQLLDENGEGAPLAGGLGAPGPVAPYGEPLAEVSLPAPLPAWRAQLYTLDAALVEGIAREQINFYWWTVGGMFAVTAGIATLAGRTLTHRIALHELSNDTLAVVSHEMKTPLAPRACSSTPSSNAATATAPAKPTNTCASSPKKTPASNASWTISRPSRVSNTSAAVPLSPPSPSRPAKSPAPPPDASARGSKRPAGGSHWRAMTNPPACARTARD